MLKTIRQLVFLLVSACAAAIWLSAVTGIFLSPDSPEIGAAEGAWFLIRMLGRLLFGP